MSEAFPLATAHRLAEHLEIHHTPKHGSYLKIAENDRAALTCQCLDRCIPERGTLERETSA